MPVRLNYSYFPFLLCPLSHPPSYTTFPYHRINPLYFPTGNASQVSDGAAAVLLARRSVARRLNLPILGKFVAAVTVGVPPRIMGVGPAYAIPRVLEKTGLSQSDIDFYEINEAFASQAIYSIEKLGLDESKVNIHGGAIAIGHPLGCSEYYPLHPMYTLFS
jgi:acetyl-CoA acyltransferase 1